MTRSTHASRRTRVNKPAQFTKQTVRDSVAELLQALAPTLVESGVTAHQIADLAKDALIAAASPGARMASGRINHSKVAALTGLTRVEVRIRTSPRSKPRQTPIRALDRSARAVAGWTRDPQFLDKKGRPMRLTLRGRFSGFQSLVRKHSGDVPPRAVLEALKAKGLVEIVDGAVQLKPTRVSQQASTGTALLELSPYLENLIRTAATSASRLGYAHAVTLVADSPTHEIVLTDRAVEILASAIAALTSMPEANKPPHSTGDYRKLTLSVALLSAPGEESLHRSEPDETK